MPDHIILTVSNLPRSIAFYSKVLAPLGITNVLDYKGRDGHPDLMGFGRENNFLFWLRGGYRGQGLVDYRLFPRFGPGTRGRGACGR
jgi:catechol 2,3-dioxygenase-like lactoylglutathione lyase family enzyme